MKYEIVDGEGGPTLLLKDQLVFTDRDAFDVVCAKLLARRSHEVLVDLAGLDYMDSAGLGMLLTLKDRAERDKAAVKLLHPKGEVQQLLTLACFDSLFPIIQA